jgi:hypothetical protein
MCLHGSPLSLAVCWPVMLLHVTKVLETRGLLDRAQLPPDFRALLSENQLESAVVLDF